MKSFFVSLLACALWIIPVSAHAALFPLEATKTATDVTVTMTGAPNTQTVYQLKDGDTILTSSGVTGESMAKRAVNGTVTWKLSGSALKQSGFYYFTAIQTVLNQPVPVSETKVLAVKDGETASLLKEFTIRPSGDGKVTVSGKLDTSVYPNPRVLTVTFYSSQTGTLAEGPTNAGPITAGADGQSDIASDGTYAIVVSNLTPGAKYFFKQTISANGSATPLEQKIDTFTAEKGYLVPGSVGEQLDFNSRSYHLLAPLPGLSVLMDPDLCAEKKASGAVPENAICDVNGLLDYAFKLLIGFAAVMLVLRLMYEGYVILTSDVPFIQAKSKEGFKTALIGLLLALSAYVILNTINPKLVNNKISIDSIGVGIIPSDGHDYRLQETQGIAGSTVFKRSPFYAKIKTVSAQYNIPHCLLQTAIQRESGGIEKLIGHDEDVASSGIKSRRDFIASGKKADGTTFATSGPSDPKVNQRNFLNTDHIQGNIHSAPNPNAQDLGLDWRFSHSVGLFGVTFFPAGSKYGDVTKGLTSTTISGKSKLFPKDIFNTDIDISFAAELMSAAYKDKNCAGNPEKTFRKYGAGDCDNNSPFIRKEAPLRKNLYDQCVAQDR